MYKGLAQDLSSSVVEGDWLFSSPTRRNSEIVKNTSPKTQLPNNESKQTEKASSNQASRIAGTFVVLSKLLYMKYLKAQFSYDVNTI